MVVEEIMEYLDASDIVKSGLVYEIAHYQGQLPPLKRDVFTKFVNFDPEKAASAESKLLSVSPVSILSVAHLVSLCDRPNSQFVLREIW